ncbi:carbohydrate-binding module family 13 protein [Rhizophagus clarus]|uniref:Carbohydrate-binding module family 13 protein n=1 Tax=Rhizophagus clarus TaxID=94130 RepID=A0A8H3KYP6_9GLOM|nr:carbohydrate-binding module family 13 protein [Rhizophagus clarus]
MTQNYVNLISKWIDRLEITDELISSYQYEFKLLFSGSRDGLDRNKFHKICDNGSRTVTFVKVKDSTEILGEYTNPLDLKSNVVLYFLFTKIESITIF